MKTFQGLMLIFIAAALALAGCSGAFDTSVDDVKGWLQSPLMLFIVMNLAALGNALKAVNVANINGSDITLTDYVQHWPQTVAAVILNAIAFLILVESNTLNLAAALGIGYGVNSLADYIQPKTGRTGSIAKTTTGPSS